MKKSTRMLAAIMFTDMVGYTTLMQKDEHTAKADRDRHRKVFEALILTHQGTIIQYYGDGTLSIFSSAVEAANCAVEIQIEMHKKPQIPLRIGIHIGDIVYDDEGVYGDGVNVASRIETLSVPGGVLISDKLNDELYSHPELKTKSLGKFELKNVNRPIEIFTIKEEGLVVPTARELKVKKIDSVKSIAVLPFLNMSTDPENEYFSDGITDEILNALTKVDGLLVTSRTSSFAFKGKSKDIRQIGTKLGVNTVLEGSVRKVGNKVRITAQLINSLDGYCIWSKVYNRELEDIFEVQDEISAKIANTLREKLTGNEKKERMVLAPTKNLKAYNLYLKGIYHFNKWTPDGALKGIEFLKKTIEIEPDYAQPYSSLAYCYTMLGVMGRLSSKIAFSKAKENALKSLRLNENLVGAHLSLALIQLLDEWNLDSACKSFQRALELSPGLGGVHHAYYAYLIAVKRFDEAIKEMKLAVQIDPLSLPINNSLAEAYMYAGKYNIALKQINKTLEFEPTFRTAVETKGWIHIHLGETEKAIEIFKDFTDLTKTPLPLKGRIGLGYAYAKAGRINDAKECIRKMQEREKKDKDASLNMDYLVIYMGLGDFDKVFHYLEKALNEDSSLYFLRVHPSAESIRKDPRYKELMNKYGLVS
jgi:TolB-like protein/class 3 adenylate cyclase/Tfp pilus assembly protein PilF